MTNNCGTVKGYNNHLKEKTPTCTECKKAYATYRRMLKRKKEKEENIKKFPIPRNTKQDEEIRVSKRILEHRENLAFVCDAMREASPRELASLSKRRQELSELIFELEKKENKTTIQNNGGSVNRLDEIRKRRPS